MWDVNGACFADLGNNVLCLDVDEPRLNRPKRASPFFEPGSRRWSAQSSQAVFASRGLSQARSSTVQFMRRHFSLQRTARQICPTCWMAARSSAAFSALSGLVDKSSVPVGTAEKVREVIAAEGTPRLASRVHVVSNPEFLKEGAAIEDFMRPDRIVVGTMTGEQKDSCAHIFRITVGKQTV